jgi:endonuclease-8
MPEGDTIHRTAAALRTALAGQPLRAFLAPRHHGPVPRLGAVTQRVESHGKQLEIAWDDGMVLRTHMRMTGAWHIYRSGERWRRPRGQARVVIGVDGFEAVCFNAPVVEITFAGARAATSHLGPDLCRAGVDVEECVERLGRLRDPASTIAEALLDQRVACGVGNVYKSEVLWACRVHPLRAVGAVEVATRHQLLETAARFLQANLAGPARITIPGAPGGLAVYGRGGRRCPRCGTRITSRRHGEHGRVSYWCPSCQPE